MKTKEEIEEKIRRYWEQIDRIESKIEELSNKGISYQTLKRKSLLFKIERLIKQREKLK